MKNLYCTRMVKEKKTTPSTAIANKFFPTRSQLSGDKNCWLPVQGETEGGQRVAPAGRTERCMQQVAFLLKQVIRVSHCRLYDPKTEVVKILTENHVEKIIVHQECALQSQIHSKWVQDIFKALAKRVSCSVPTQRGHL